MLLPRDQLERQYSCNDVELQTYTSCAAATVRSAIPDPDVSQSCGDSSGYVNSTTLCVQWLLKGIHSVKFIFHFYLSEYELSFPLIMSRISPTKLNRDNVVTNLLQQTPLRGLSPPWIRPSPPRLEILEGEVRLLVKRCKLFIHITSISKHRCNSRWNYSCSGWTWTITMSYYGIVACVLTLAEGLRSVIWLEEPVKDRLHLPNKRFSSTLIFKCICFLGMV